MVAGGQSVCKGVVVSSKVEESVDGAERDER